MDGWTDGWTDGQMGECLKQIVIINIYMQIMILYYLHIYIINIHRTHTYIMFINTCILEVINCDYSLPSTNLKTIVYG